MAMTASISRSRRADDSHLAKSRIADPIRLLSAKRDQHTSPRAKRHLEPSGRDYDQPVAKRPRYTTEIAVEIPDRLSSFHHRLPKQSADVRPAPAPAPAAKSKPIGTAAGPNNAPTSHRAPPPNCAEPVPASTKQPKPARTKHQEKVANGLKHELSRLQPNLADTKDQGRKLRSQEATRFKSELSAYFPEYDEVIGNDPKETHLLNLETPIVITSGAAPQSSQQPHRAPSPAATSSFHVRSYGDALFTDLFDSQRIDFSFLNKNNPLPALDPLPDESYEPSHRKAERHEKSYRNTEKGRAQHERDQIIRLLDGLQGQDWLRVMGVSGVTESKKRTFEPAREYFIKGCESIIDKFKRWAAEEKRLKREKLQAEKRAKREAAESPERSTTEGEVSTEEEDDESEEEDQDQDSISGPVVGMCDDSDSDGPDPEGEPPDDSDVDAKIAKQLREEALAAAAAKKNHPSRASKPRLKRGIARPVSKSPTPPEREFTSFFRDRTQRNAALKKNTSHQQQQQQQQQRSRRGTRTAAAAAAAAATTLAWGQPVPELRQKDFELPVEMRDEETMRYVARKRRRERRGRSSGA
ncbi:hypothetical protein VTI74DRAFT_1650 [Chaetomium olivicolor]